MSSSGAGAVASVLAVLIGLISLRASNPWLLVVACALLSPVLISRLLRPDLASITVCFSSPDRVIVGDAQEQVFHVHNHGRRSSPAVLLDHRTIGFPAITLAAPALPPGGAARLAVLRTAEARGVSAVHHLRLRTTAPFGMKLYQRRLTVSNGTRISVHPARGPVASLPDTSQGVGGGRPNRFGDEPHELREWRHGDSLRQVHWRATARHDRLTVVIPENTVRARLAMVVLGPADDTLEALLSTAAWTAVQAVRSDAVLRLSAPGSPEYIGDDPGAVLDWFAALGPLTADRPGLLADAVTWAGTGSVVLAGTKPADLGRVEPGTLLLTPDGRVSPT
jgi:uncharacterized protein (DUF58 family)